MISYPPDITSYRIETRFCRGLSQGLLQQERVLRSCHEGITELSNFEVILGLTIAGFLTARKGRRLAINRRISHAIKLKPADAEAYEMVLGNQTLLSETITP